MSPPMVTLSSAKGVIKRVVVADHGAVISVCTEEEWYRARAEQRKPHSIGFKKTDIIPEAAP